MPTLSALANRALGSAQHRIFGLDLLRAVAIFSTVYGHAGLLGPPAYRSGYNLLVSAIAEVTIFFVLSRYLIGGILLRAPFDRR